MGTVTGRGKSWTLEDLVDFEQAIAGKPVTSDEDTRAAVAMAATGKEAGAARRAGLRVWLDRQRRGPAGRRFVSALGLLAACFGLLAWIGGLSAMLGMWDRSRGGVNVTLFIAVLIGGQWLLLLIGLLGWLFSRRAAEGFSGVQIGIGRLARRLTGDREPLWWRGLIGGGSSSRAAIVWRLARISQAAGLAFNLGILSGLIGLVLVRHIGFYWETTTEGAMQSVLATGVRWLSLPWISWWPGAVPNDAVIEATRLVPGEAGRLGAGPAAWWQFLMMAVFVWGFLPRGLWWLVAWRAERRALASLDFQGRQHRALWRELAGSGREETEEKPLDGVLVLDVGGSGLSHEILRPFLLRRLRVHPASWKTTAVLDPGAEQEASEAMAKAPAGVVLLAEGWALSPPRMSSLHSRMRAATTPETPLKFLVANASPEGLPLPPTDEERHEWVRFVDGLRDPAAEVYFYEDVA